MEPSNSLSAVTDRAVGAIKEGIGKAIGNLDLQAEGCAQNAVGHAKQTGEHVEDTARDTSGDLE